MDRRLFLFSAAALPIYAGPLVTFSEGEARVVAAITDLVVPADDMPGALAAGGERWAASGGDLPDGERSKDERGGRALPRA